MAIFVNTRNLQRSVSWQCWRQSSMEGVKNLTSRKLLRPKVHSTSSTMRLLADAYVSLYLNNIWYLTLTPIRYIQRMAPINTTGKVWGRWYPYLSFCVIKSLINQPGTGAEKVAKIGMFLGHHQAAVWRLCHHWKGKKRSNIRLQYLYHIKIAWSVDCSHISNHK